MFGARFRWERGRGIIAHLPMGRILNVVIVDCMLLLMMGTKHVRRKVARLPVLPRPRYGGDRRLLPRVRLRLSHDGGNGAPGKDRTATDLIWPGVQTRE